MSASMEHGCKTTMLNNYNESEQKLRSQPVSSLSEATNKAYILHFSNDMPAFIDAELRGITDATGIDLTQLSHHSPDCPYRKYYNLSNEDVVKLCQRSVSLRGICEYWCEADSLEELLISIAKHTQCDEERSKSFKICIQSFNRSYTNRTEERLSRIDRVAVALDLAGPVKLSKPQVTYFLFEYFGSHGSKPTQEPSKLYFGKLVSESRREPDIRKFNMKTRKFIGNTSMDPTLSLLMANMAGVTNHSLILDPFVGTGSLLLACAHYGAYAVGTDINKVLLHGRGRSSRAKRTWRELDENVRANFEQYKMGDKYVDVLVADSSKHDLWSIDGLFDAIVTDPPYGIREQTLKLEAPAADARKPHFMPPISQYSLSDVFTDLLTLSSRCLVLGGKLVFWLPIFRPDYHDDNIPAHPCFKLISNCEQVLSTFIARRLITLQKIREPADVEDCDWTGIVNRDHYSESFRDRYFQMSNHTSKLTLDRKPVPEGESADTKVAEGESADTKVADSGDSAASSDGVVSAATAGAANSSYSSGGSVS